jgi:hypothetical protein
LWRGWGWRRLLFGVHGGVHGGGFVDRRKLLRGKLDGYRLRFVVIFDRGRHRARR